MEKLSKHQLKVLKYVEKNSNPVTAENLTKHFKAFDAVSVANELIKKPYECLSCPHIYGDFSLMSSTKDNFSITDKGKLQLYENRLDIRNIRVERIISFVFGVLTGLSIRVIGDLLLALLTRFPQ